MRNKYIDDVILLGILIAIEQCKFYDLMSVMREANKYQCKSQEFWFLDKIKALLELGEACTQEM